jgi:two-component system NtrC family sensor kinase
MNAFESHCRILVVDDLPAIQGDFRRILAPRSDAHRELDRLEQELLGESTMPAESTSFEIDAASQGEEGLARVRAALAEKRPYALAFVDIRMPPGWDGIETIERLWQVDPDLQVVICSAYSDYNWETIRARLGNTDGLLILRKPFDATEVVQLAHALTRKWVLQGIARRKNDDLEAMIRTRTAELEHTNTRLMAELQRTAEMESELRLVQKLQSIGQLAAGIGHEINTPIQYVSDNVDFLRTAFGRIDGLRQRATEIVAELASRSGDRTQLDELGALERRARLEHLAKGIPAAFEAAGHGLGRISAIVRALKVFAHPDNDEKNPVDLDQLLLATIEVARSEYKLVADVETELCKLPPVMCASGELGQVFINLIVNAAHAIADVVGKSGARGTIRASTRLEGDTAVISIADTGGGIPESVRGRIFDPFFTTKGVGRGSGQGLAIARAIVDRHGGSLTFETSTAGTTFCVRIPVGAEAEASAA